MTDAVGDAVQCRDVTPANFRQVLGQFCTGLTVVTGADAAGPAGFCCQSFSSLSLDPPLVLFCPSVSSRTWSRIGESGSFCVNILAAEQRELAEVFAGPQQDRFRDVPWSPAPSGSPVLDGVLAWLDCEVRAAYRAGDHYVVVGAVARLGHCRPGEPLLVFRSRYGSPPAGLRAD
jgi:3-hydroxy-9,10-secoandrosta-1,3,5(10)-triene-9,17-dione monooxygenase reductase component